MASTKKQQRPAVQIFHCPAAFPISKNKDKQAREKKQLQVDVRGPTANNNSRPKQEYELDFALISREIRNFGATGFVKQKKKAFEDEQYERLTGRKRKGIKVPLPILRRRKKRHAERQAVEEQQAKEAGIVTETRKKKHNKRQHKSSSSSSSSSHREARIHGPAPSVGFMAKGILRVNPKRIINDV